MSFSLEHLDDHPPAARSGRSGSPDDVNWFPMVRAAFLAALTAFLVKLVSLGFFANRAGISLEVRFWSGFIPHLSMQTPPAEFARIVTSSTLVMAVVSTLAFTVMVLRTNADRLVVWGWFMGVFVTFETLLLELLRHLLEPPVVDPATVWRTAIPLTAGAAIAVAYSLITRERVERPTAAGAPRVVRAGVDPAGETRSVDARPAGFQGAPAVVTNPFADGPPAPAPVAVPGPVEPRVPAEPAAPPDPRAPEPLAPAVVAASVPNRIVDTRPAAEVPTSPEPADLPPARVPTRPAADVGPAPIVDTRPGSPSVAAEASHGPNDLSRRPTPASNQ